MIKVIQFCSNNYGNFILMGDDDARVTETNMASFCETYELKSLINERTCYKNPLNSSFIHLFLTNNINSFHKFCHEKGTLGFPYTQATMKKFYIPKQKRNIIQYRDYKNFDKSKFEKQI